MTETPSKWKRWSQAVARGVLVCMALLFLAYGVLMLRFVWGTTSINTDYLAKVNERAAAVPEDERAWPIYREVALQLHWDDPAVYDNWCREWATLEDDGEAMHAWLDEHRNTITLLHEVGNYESFGYVIPGVEPAPEDRILFEHIRVGSRSSKTPTPMFFDLWLPHLEMARRLNRVLAADAERCLETGDGERLLADVRAMWQIAEHLQEHPLLRATLMSQSCRWQAMKVMADALVEHPEWLSDDVLRGWLDELSGLDVESEMLRSLQSEHWKMLDLLQHTYTDDGQGSGRLAWKNSWFLQGRLRELVGGPLMMALVKSRREGDADRG